MPSDDRAIDLRWLIAHRLDEMRSLVRTVRPMKDGRLVVDLDDGSRHEVDVREIAPARYRRSTA
jgi:hypothetical protein